VPQLRKARGNATSRGVSFLVETTGDPLKP
jgi:hypothetical protein